MKPTHSPTPARIAPVKTCLKTHIVPGEHTRPPFFKHAVSHLAVTFAILVFLAPSLRAQEIGEAALNFLYDHPREGGDLGWNEEAQGLAHNATHWFITQKNALWKIPATSNLWAKAVPGASGVIASNICSYLELADFTDRTSHPKANPHFGDPELITTNGEEYLFVPIVTYDYCKDSPDPTCDGRPEGIAVFRGSDLSYVAHTNQLPSGASGESWCALDGVGNLYVPNKVANLGDPFSLRKISVDFAALRASPPALVLNDLGPVQLRDEADFPVDLNKDYHQGGVFSPNGEYLYIVNGGPPMVDPLLYYLDPEAAAAEAIRQSRNMGIHVFSVSNWRRIQQSSQASRPFIFQFDAAGWPGPMQEPEGITFWDLDDGKVSHDSHVGGQLHALVLDNDVGPDDVYIKHYTSAISIDRGYSGAEWGIPDLPFNTVGEGNNYAWDGADLRIKAGSYPEALTFTKKLHIFADGGTVTIGR